MNFLNQFRLNFAYILAGFNKGEAQNFVKSYTDPLTSFLLWAVPVVAIIASVISGITYLIKDEEDRYRKKFSKELKRILFVAIIIESISLIFKIVGIATS